MNHKVKRFLLGASTLLIAGVAYAKSNVIPSPSNTLTTNKNTNQVNDKALLHDLSTVSQQVTTLQKKVQDETSIEASKKKQLQSLQSQEVTIKAHAIAVMEQKALVAEEQAMAQAQSARQSKAPSVQTVTRASGGDDRGRGDDGGEDD